MFETSLGSFTCRLEYQQAPRTVANFMRLARRDAYPWIDPATGVVRHRPFYDGIVFHRVIAGFVIQAGSPVGDGSDGPGYAFPDEFAAGLRHSAAGILSMANSGLNANGSQFFVTLAPTPGLDDVHSVFGRVTSGLDVVEAIGAAPTDGNDRPLTDVVIHGVAVVTNGVEAAAFDVDAPALPRVLEVRTRLSVDAAGWRLLTAPQPGHEYAVYGSADLADWSVRLRQLWTAAPAETWLEVTPVLDPGAAAGFFTVADVAYPGPLQVPQVLAGRQVAFSIDGVGTLTILLNADGTGAWAMSAASGAIVGSTWIPSAYNGSLTVFYDVLVPMRFSMAFDTPAGGPFRGTAYTTPAGTLTGVFTMP